MSRTSWNQPRLEELLAGKLDQAKVREALARTIRKLHLGPDFTKEDASNVLDLLCGEAGALGVAARFAKVRLVLMLDD